MAQCMVLLLGNKWEDIIMEMPGYGIYCNTNVYNS